MAQCVAIGAMQNIGLVKAKLNREFDLLEAKGLKVSMVENPAGKFTFLFCYLADCSRWPYATEDAQVVFKQYIAEAISDLILDQWEQSLIHNMIRENYYYFEPGEREIVFQQALKYAGTEDEVPCLYRVRRKSRILRKLVEFLHHDNQIIIEGFIRFRLKEYLNELEGVVDKAVDDFLVEKDYREFVQLLRYFMEIQGSQIDLVHVVFYPDGVFKLFDDQKRIVRSGILEEMVQELARWEISYGDLLVSVLVSLAPRQIVFHAPAGEHTSVIQRTIRDIFSGLVKECPGCDLCLKQ